MRAMWIVALALAPTGCMVGPSAAGFVPANGPAGVTVELRTMRAHKLAGELLEVRDTAILLLASDSVRLVPFRAVRLAAVRQRGNLDFGEGQAPDASTLYRLRQLTRFPNGLTPDLAQKLLAAHGQTEPIAVE